MGRTFAYMRISTEEERKKQKYTRQEYAIARWAKEHRIDIPDRKVYKDDKSGKSFERPQWQELESDLQPGDTVVMKDITRFSREYENGFQKYMELLDKDISLVFIDNPTISTDYIRSMIAMAEKQDSRIARKSLEDTIELLILVELDRAEQERLTLSKRTKDSLAASPNKSGRKTGQVDKLTPALRDDIVKYLHDRSITQMALINKHKICRNTLCKYIARVRAEQEC